MTAAPNVPAEPAEPLRVDVSPAERVHPTLPIIPNRTFNLADFDVKNADNPTYIRASVGPMKLPGEH